jgi:two-component sensor histidine kinase
MDVSWLQRQAQTAATELQERLARVQKALDEGISLKRRVVEELRPTLLDNMGLLAALRWQLEESCARAGLACTERFPDAEPSFSPNASIAIFRIVQEALTNVLKHAKASEVEVSLETIDEDLVLSVRDNGVGIPAECVKPRAHGLAGMRHRVFVLGGQLWVGRAPGGGTEIRVMIPLANIVAPPAPVDDAAASGTYRVFVLPNASPKASQRAAPGRAGRPATGRNPGRRENVRASARALPVCRQRGIRERRRPDASNARSAHAAFESVPCGCRSSGDVDVALLQRGDRGALGTRSRPAGPGTESTISEMRSQAGESSR